MNTEPTDLMLEKARAGRAAAAQATPMPLALTEQLGQTLDQLENQLARLAENLGPVLVEEGPSPALTGEPTPGRTLLAQRLMHLTAWAERLASRVNDLNERVEL